MKIFLVIITMLFLQCVPDTYFIGSKIEFISMGYTEKQIKKIEIIDKGNQKYTKIYYR